MKFALAGGGTGGHAYPAIAVAERLREIEGTELVYYGTEKGPERAVAENANIPYRAVPASQVRGRSPIRLATGLARLWSGSRVAARLLAADRPAA
ncbi:MAG: glycosyltransferase, partial [Chloroflexota bacterium]